MKKRILLIDESLTVQKVVALTLDKGSYRVLYAKNRQEVIKTVVDEPVDLVLLSENVTGINWQTFPKELESWLGPDAQNPPVVLVTGQDLREAKHFAAVLKKPFTPSALLEITEAFLGEPVDNEVTGESDRQLLSEDSLQSAFNRRFADENELVRQTFEEDMPEVEAKGHEVEVAGAGRRVPGQTNKLRAISAADLWESESADFESEPKQQPKIPGTPKEKTEDLWGTQTEKYQSTAEDNQMVQQEKAVLTSEDSMAYKAFLQNEVKSKIQDHDLEAMVKAALVELMPPIVEKLVQERLDELLKEHEESLAS